MSSKSIDLGRPGRGPGINMVKSNEKLKNPKETMGRLFSYIGSKKTNLYSRLTGERYSINSLVRETNIRHGSKLILL